jgi:Protein of unknown function, DUF547
MFDFTLWDNMLREYVNDRGRVDYARWQQASARELDRWLVDVRQTELQALDRDGAIAFLVNLYNALTVQQVLRNYPIPSIRPKVLGIPNWLALLWFFARKRYTLKGQSLSLNTIEHNILRQQFQDPRIHFALVCASIGCPLLRSGAYVPDTVSRQLEEEACRFVNNPDKVRYDPTSQTLYCSKIFKWYRADFLTVVGSIPAYINLYRTGVKLPEMVEIVYLPYSWDLNQRTSS